MKRLCLVLVCLLALSVFLPSARAEDARDAEKIIRIGLVDTLEQKDEFAYQMLLGYLRSYMDEVSKQNHWQYDYSTGSLEECLRRLRNGELDFVAPIQADADIGTDLLFSSGFPCYGLLSIYDAQDDPRGGHISPTTVNGSTIGVLDNEDNLQALNYHILENDWHVTVRPFSHPQELMAALRNHEVDAIVDDGTHVTGTERLLLSFAVVPAQFVAAPQKRDLLDLLTTAVLTSEKFNPSFETELEAEYLDKALQDLVRYTDAERQYIENAPVLRVAFLPDLLPLFEAHGELENSHGIYIDLLKMVANISGMRFELRQAASEDELLAMLADGEADMAFAAYTNERSPVDMYFTNEFRKEEFSVVRKRRESVDRNLRGTAALPMSFPGVQNYLQQRYGWNVRLYDSATECLNAVEREECEVAILPSLYLQRENSMVLHTSLSVMDDEELRIPISMAISPRQPQILQRVMNTAILRLNREQVARLVRENATPRFSIGYILHQYPLQTAVFLCFFLCVGALTLFIFYRNTTQRKQNEVLQQKNLELQVALKNVESMRVSRDGYKMKSRTDMLTGLFNKKATERICREQLANLPEGRLAALYILDLDHFKEANDTHGHQCGDKILQDFAEELKHIFRTSDCIGRFGGDEFVVFLTDLPDQDIVERKAAQILEAARNLRMEGADIHITSSIGIAIAPEHGREYDELFRIADQALYHVKTGGRNGYSIDARNIVR